MQANQPDSARAREVNASAFPEEIRDACGVGLLADLHGRAGRHLLPLALGALKRLAHRGAVDADGRTGDGAGVTTQVPYAMLRPELEALGLGSCAQDDLAMGMVFLPRIDALAAKGRRLIAAALASHGLAVAAWRDVPFDESALGEKARRCRPGITHLLVVRPAGMTSDDFELRLFLARKEAESKTQAAGLSDVYIASLSQRTLVYKALVRGVDLAEFFGDLRNAEFETSFVMFHQRFSTNTLPSWAMAQPFRLLAHNGEINTIGGNRNWMRAREQGISGSVAGGKTAVSLPILTSGASDSASLDEALSLLTAAGRDVAHGLTLLMPPAWEGNPEVCGPVRSMFDYQASQMEPWDGPAMVLFTDGRVVGAALDRNGLRPARYLVTADGLLLVSSEVGVMDVEEDAVLTRGRLGPGDIVAVDLEAGRFLDRDTLHRELAARHPYGEWLSAQRATLEDVRSQTEFAAGDEQPGANVQTMRAFGYTREEQLLILTPMYKDGVEPLGSMGDDAPLAVLSSRGRLMFSSFKQRFAQVTNPPIDPIREALVMALDSRLGPSAALLSDGPLPGPHVHLADPILEPRDVHALLTWKRAGWRARRLGLLFPARGQTVAFEDALEALIEDAERAVSEGATCIVLSDRGVDTDNAALPSLLALSAVHQHLVRSGLRLATSLVVETGEARDDHQVASLLGFGADAVSPYLALEAVADAARTEDGEGADVDAAQRRYRKTLSKGLLKIMSKMGVSTLRSYRGAQLFEAIGISDGVIARHFTGTPSSIGGATLTDIANGVLERHKSAFVPEVSALEEGGLHRFRRNDETHAYEPRVIKALHNAIKTGTKLDYRSYADLVHSREPVTLRDLMEFVERTPISIGMVEPVTAILPRFMSAAMSLGALSPEAQQVLSIAMNRMGARSNSGEGGESAELFWGAKPGEDKASNRIKQVASGRFGVTAAYLMSADEIQIKMAQGSKPGEGGQLPGHKVTAHIARVRHAAQGTTLISPPPHHDIYSIEDLAQLIYDLKRVNPVATVSVKLVSSAGIGTIALGVAKAHADAIQISGHDGGTGASPRGSIKNAGTPWELGLSEAQQALQRGGLRGPVRLQVDGGLKTGRDVVIAALLGAEEFGFGTAPLVAAGCLMARQCHLNTCPAGIATQREDLRAKFTGTPEDIIHFFTSVAEEVREILALLGFRRLNDVIGHTELLETRLPASVANGTAARVNLGRMLDTPPDAKGPPRWAGARNEPPLTGARLDEGVLSRLRFGAKGLAPMQLTLPITNADRTVGARIAGEIVRRLRGASAAPGTLKLRYTGAAGQSFGAFCVEGMSLVVEGEANDGVGKGMSGGEIVVRPPVGAHRASNQIIAGNTLLYGATGGHAFVAGCVGERFAVRNSGALAIVEGTGDHACEYMTAGAVVILGPTGRNLGAGMSGGTVFVLDAEDALERRHNPDWVVVESDISETEETWLRAAIARHVQVTGSVHAAKLLADWSKVRLQFKRVAPPLAVRPVQALPALVHAVHDIVKTTEDAASYTNAVSANA